jgi:transcription termination factor Rho
MPAKRHTEVAEMVLERSRRLVEQGKDVVIVLDSITRMARAHNTAERGTGRTLSGGLDSSAMAEAQGLLRLGPHDRPGTRRRLAHDHRHGARRNRLAHGRRDLRGVQGHRQLRDQARPWPRREAHLPAFDIATSGTRREEKLYRPDQLQKVHLLRRGLAQMPPQAAWSGSSSALPVPATTIRCSTGSESPSASRIAPVAHSGRGDRRFSPGMGGTTGQSKSGLKSCRGRPIP